MKKILFVAVAVVAISACAQLPAPKVDAGPVNAGSLKSAFGATVTGRDWNAQPSESRGTAGNGDGKE
jgi:hypothetical protein